VRDDDDFVLVVAWLLNALRGNGQHPILVQNGGEGAAKTTRTLILQALIDPNCMPLGGLPHSERELRTRSRHLWCEWGGRSEGLRPADPEWPHQEWIAMWLMDATSGNWWLGVSFPTWSEKSDSARCFQVVEPDLASDPETLFEQLRSRKAFGLHLPGFKRLLKRAPCQVVMSPVGSGAASR
jgi:hypothetical protein